MKHARDDYNRIQDPENKIPENEPVFLFRGQDKFSSTVLRIYASLVYTSGGSMDIVNATYAQADLMDSWKTKKSPDMPTQPPEN